jgi:hypothetical protein
MILPGLWRDLGERIERIRNFAMRTVFKPFAGINEFERRVSSQNGEDGIIDELFRRIGTTDRYFVEFGVSDGAECNTALLASAGWSGVMLEGDADRHRRLAERYAGMPGVKTEREFVNAENIAAIFAKLGVPAEFDLLSIDIDGNDYWVWQALGAYRPRVVVIEYNAEYPPPRRWVMKYDPGHRWNETTYYGASLASLEAVGKRLGYALLGTDLLGVNAFFVRADLAHGTQFPTLDAQRAFHPAKYYGASTHIGHVPGDGPFVEV